MDLTEAMERFLKESEEFRNAFGEHKECGKRIDKLNKKKVMTVEEANEEKTLKIKKLVLKDKLEKMLVEAGVN
ncbi:MAG: hypothetical protein WA162_00115 [Thermodesulfobacteriota bacterium]